MNTMMEKVDTCCDCESDDEYSVSVSGCDNLNCSQVKVKKNKFKVLIYEKAWAEGNFNSNQRSLIAQMTDERRKEVLQILGL